jgi:hypothetical protein
MKEASSLAVNWDIAYITSLFVEIEKCIKDEPADSIPSGLRNSGMFPIRSSSSTSGFDQLLRANSAKEWFIADCSHFQRSFNGKVPLLAFEVAEVGRMKVLIRKAGVENRRLSAVANGTAKTEGVTTFLDGETVAFKKKVNSILR